MNPRNQRSRWCRTPRRSLTGLAFLSLVSACSEEAPRNRALPKEAKYALTSVVIDADGNRTTYLQTLASLSDGPFDNRAAIEMPGNGVVLAHGASVYAGLAEEPTWVRYSVDDNGAIQESGRLSLLATGAAQIDYGNVIVDDDTAVSVLTNPPLAVVWSPKTMELLGEIELGFLARDGYSLEVWTTVAHDGLVYVPARWSDWDGSRIYPAVSTTVINPKTLEVVGTAQDERCASGGRVVFDRAGYAYVMGDGRNYSIAMFANANGTQPPANCILRMAPGATAFEPNYFYTIATLTDGHESITELETAEQGSGIAFSKMFYPEHLAPGTTATDFGFWQQPAHKLWRIELGEPPRAREVEGVPFSAIGFAGSSLEGRLFTGEAKDGGSDVYEIDPELGSARYRFTMAGYFDGLYALAGTK